MKKTIKILTDKIDKLQEHYDGTLEGGFSALKGGFRASLASTNKNPCTNTGDCTQSSNAYECTNSGTCFL